MWWAAVPILVVNRFAVMVENERCGKGWPTVESIPIALRFTSLLHYTPFALFEPATRFFCAHERGDAFLLFLRRFVLENVRRGDHEGA
jgi:hypothetical protein